MGQGYIYVLANSSMVNMVKVGKTTRQPSLRAQELSNVTGVPTPFIVVYEKIFNDCDAAEIFIHELLSIKGGRVASNREFFNLPVNEVIDAVLQALSYDTDSKNDIKSTDNQDNSNDYSLPVWWDIWEEANNYLLGLDNNLKDFNEAMRLYKNAIKLGCIAAYQKIAMIYSYGLGVSQSSSKALEWYKEGVRKNNYFCYLFMSRIYIEEWEIENARKCLELFCQFRESHYNTYLEVIFKDDYVGDLLEVVEILSKIESNIGIDNFIFPSEFIDYLRYIKDDIINYIDTDENDVALHDWFDINL